MNANEGKLILTLGECIDAQEINRRVAEIRRIELQNITKLDFNPVTDPEILELNQGIGLEQVFQIENTIMEKEVNSVKRQSVIKIKNLKYNMYISTEMKKLDGEAEEGDDGGEKKEDDQEADKTQDNADES